MMNKSDSNIIVTEENVFQSLKFRLYPSEPKDHLNKSKPVFFPPCRMSLG